MKTAFALLAGALLSGAGAAVAQTTSATNDIAVLNYALTLEHLEATFYAEFQAKFNASSFTSAGYSSAVYNYLSIIEGHEQAHVALLTSVISMLGGTPVPAGSYDFSAVTSPGTYLAYARVLENTGVSAYDGALSSITNPTLQEAAASIATVEARHASYLNYLNGVTPFPNVTDPTDTPAMVAALVTPFITSPSTLNITLPVPRANTSDYMPETSAEMANDLLTLNYALTLEHLEATFYTEMQAKFTEAEFTAAGLPNGTYAYLSLIESHEQAHVAALTATIESLNGTAVPNCTYDFSSVTSVATYINTAAKLENTGVSAYDGAVNTITNALLQQTAATIATVEGRHAAYLNYLVGVVPFPNVTDVAYTPSQIISAAGPFFVSCPYNFTLPTYPPSYNSSAI